jgi:hypothetical protein
MLRRIHLDAVSVVAAMLVLAGLIAVMLSVFNPVR